MNHGSASEAIDCAEPKEPAPSVFSYHSTAPAPPELLYEVASRSGSPSPSRSAAVTCSPSTGET